MCFVAILVLIFGASACLDACGCTWRGGTGGAITAEGTTVSELVGGADFEFDAHDAASGPRRRGGTAGARPAFTSETKFM